MSVGALEGKRADARHSAAVNRAAATAAQLARHGKQASVGATYAALHVRVELHRQWAEAKA